MLTVHHLQVSQSDRIVWLCEELEIPYKLKLHQRDPLLSPQSIKDLHPIGAAPIIQDGDLTLAESAACAEYIIHKHGDGRLALAPSHKNYAAYLYWFHFANGTLQPGVSRMAALRGAKVDPTNQVYKIYQDKLDNYFRHLDERLGASTWLAGEEFTAADIMSVFSMTTMREFFPYDLSGFPNILSYLQRATSRPAYQRYHKKGDPNIDLSKLIGGPAPERMLTAKLG